MVCLAARDTRQDDQPTPVFIVTLSMKVEEGVIITFSFGLRALPDAGEAHLVLHIRSSGAHTALHPS